MRKPRYSFDTVAQDAREQGLLLIKTRRHYKLEGKVFHCLSDVKLHIASLSLEQIKIQKIKEYFANINN